MGRIAHSPSRFNPLPSQKQGETRRRDRHFGLRRVSIRSPHKSKGRHATPHVNDGPVPVSIRSPHKSKGRQDATDRGP